MTTKLYFDDELMGVRLIKFSGGELQPRIVGGPSTADVVRIVCHATSSDDIMEALLIRDAAEEWINRYTHYRETVPLFRLEIPYLPYARQDRVCSPGEANALRVMCRLIVTANFDQVEVWDVHNVDAVDRYLADTEWTNYMPSHFIGGIRDLLEDTVVIAPDKGAYARAADAASALDAPVYAASKVRDPGNGAILGIEIDSMPHVGRTDLLMVDDICDGGRTFIELAKCLREKTSGRILLYVTHGIFSRGLDVFDGLVDRVYCPNVFPNVGEHPLLVRI